ncbi:hypothetical protein SAMN05216266_10512 [Amycolatopsis marina]|uniref:Uncharacterized protein n=1 Tax=Amycolatopsis marina TaxID=490629 RepID=A0A1I0YFZ7_9PSEU|nr:hypothetical protein [Amycolatopsis marina]SFB11716.1 hypothetical protein SAMN05216266_10512 [Amycolatopsis marina]
MSTQNSGGVRDYLARVRTALADLPDAEVEEILEDVRPHLQDIGTELGESATLAALVERLGSPESYAAELRAAGGYPAPPVEQAARATEPKRNTGARLAAWSLVLGVFGVLLTGFGVAVNLADDYLYPFAILLPVLGASAWYVWKHGVRPVEDLPEMRRIRDTFGQRESGRIGAALRYLASLRPAWWLLCAAVLLGLGVLLLLGSVSAVLALPVFVAVGVAVLWAGPKSAEDRRLLWVSLPVSAFVVGSLLGLAGQFVEMVYERGTSGDPYYSTGRYSSGPNELLYDNRLVENIYAFDAEGKPLTDVYLYDGQGNPLTTARYGCDKSTGSNMRVGEDNHYPRPHIDYGAYDDQGYYNGYNAYRPTCREITGVPFSAAIPKSVTPQQPGEK